jgi:hypothetical protein
LQHRQSLCRCALNIGLMEVGACRVDFLALF